MPDNPTQVAVKDCRTLPIDDISIGSYLFMRVLNSRGKEVSRTQIKQLEKFMMMPGQMIEIKAQKFDVTLSPSSGEPLDDSKKGTLQMRVKFIQTPVSEAPVPTKIAVPNVEEEEIAERPKVVLNPGSKGLRTGTGKKPVAPVKDSKSNAFDQMEDIGEPVLADDPPLDEDEEQKEEEEDNDMGFIGKQPGDNRIKPQETLIN